MRFYLGTHEPHWLTKLDVPLFVARQRITRCNFTSKAICQWALDSGGFTELNKFGKWSLTAWQYAREVKKFEREIGNLQWCAPMDWMCEDFVLQKTGKTVQFHIDATVASFLELEALGLPVVPVIQGYHLHEYLNCVDAYAKHGVDLTTFDTVGIGSVCRRQATDEAADLITNIVFRVPGIQLHGFGFKKGGLLKVGGLLRSADSLAWSYDARYNHGPLPGCKHRNCGNCPKFAMLWRSRLLASVTKARFGA